MATMLDALPVNAVALSLSAISSALENLQCAPWDVNNALLFIKFELGEADTYIVKWLRKNINLYI